MTPEEFRKIVEAWGGSTKAGKLLRMSPRTVRALTTGQMGIKPHVEQLVRLTRIWVWKQRRLRAVGYEFRVNDRLWLFEIPRHVRYLRPLVTTRGEDAWLVDTQTGRVYPGKLASGHSL